MVRFAFITLLSLLAIPGLAQESPVKAKEYHLKMTLDEVVETAREQSPAAMIAKYNFLSGYWQYRTYKATFLPSLNLSANVGNYNRSLTALQDASTGEYKYIENNNMYNNISLSVNQNIALTGGTLTLSSSLYRLDQFSPFDNVLYNSKPLSLIYNQPIQRYNSFKWEKIIEPKEYEKAQKEYLEEMEAINIEAADRFFAVLSAQKGLEMAEKNFSAAELSVNIGEKRYEIGAIPKNDLLQLQMSLYEAQLSINDKKMAFEMAMVTLRSYLGYNETVSIELLMPQKRTELKLEYTDVLGRATKNSSTALKNELTLITAKEAVAKAKSDVGLQASIHAQFGINQTANKLVNSYKNPMDQEVVGLSLSLPILDWGLGKGKIKLARSKEDVAKTQVEQAEAEYRQDILIKVLQFNNQSMQCDISAKNDSIAKLRYDIAMEKFKNNSISVTELNNAQSAKDAAVNRFILDLNNYWQYFYTIRKLSLYDYISKKEVTTDFNLLIEN